jgi:hypothetical protein
MDGVVGTPVKLLLRHVGCWAALTGSVDGVVALKDHAELGKAGTIASDHKQLFLTQGARPVGGHGK